MKALLKAVLKRIDSVSVWLMTVVSGSDAASTKRFVLLMFAAASIFWLSAEQHSHAFSPAWERIYGTLTALVGSCYLGGKAIESYNNKKPSQKDGEQP